MRVLAKVKKNKTAPPFREAGFDLLFKQGIDSVGCVIDAAEVSVYGCVCVCVCV